MKEENYNGYHRNIKDYKRILWAAVHNKLDNLEEMDKFLKSYKPSGLNHEEIENLYIHH